MHTYKINYTTETAEGEATLTLDRMATKLQIIEAVARHCHPDEQQEIGDIFDEADHAGLKDYLALMAKWNILRLSYTIDDELEEHYL
ncbi:MAG: hypothetical protein JWP38_2568 [Herbaspirillum sp.]|nr:hypothetical protein [Herbaspirillum sp.]